MGTIETEPTSHYSRAIFHRDGTITYNVDEKWFYNVPPSDIGHTHLMRFKSYVRERIVRAAHEAPNPKPRRAAKKTASKAAKRPKRA